jgi:hypothetical protein
MFCHILFLTLTLVPVKGHILALYRFYFCITIYQTISLRISPRSIKMGYSKSYMFFNLVLFVILYFQVLTAIDVHDEPPIIDVGGTSYVAHLLDYIRGIFIKFDEDHNHFISVDEFRHFATKFDKHEMNVETADSTVGAYDHNGDWQLNLNEFTHIVMLMIKDRDSNGQR